MIILELDVVQCNNAEKHLPFPVFTRQPSAAICPTCKYEYIKHPQAVPFLSLNILCNGEYVKL